MSSISASASSRAVISASSYSGSSHPVMVGATNAALCASPLRRRSIIARMAPPEPSSPNVIASENGARVRAPEARISVSKASSDRSARLTRRSAESTAVTVPRTNSMPNSAVISGSDRLSAGPKPKGSATVIGRSTNHSSCETSVRATRSPAKARNASSASSPATPPPTMTT